MEAKILLLLWPEAFSVPPACHNAIVFYAQCPVRLTVQPRASVFPICKMGPYF